MEFNKNDWAHLHDVVLNATGKRKKQHELEVVFENLPEDLIELAIEWGMSDTVFRDKVYELLKKNSQ